jgi:hypothetical protein
MDLYIGTLGINSSALKVACGAPGIGAKKVQESSADDHSPTYPASDVALESAGVDLDICTCSINSSALEVACPPPEIGATKILRTTSEILTFSASELLLVWKVVSWISTFALVT